MSDERTALIPHEASPASYGYPQPYDYADSYDIPNGEDEGSQINLSLWWRAALKRKWLILALVVLTTVVVSVRMYQIRSTYKASAVLEVGKEDTSLVKYGDLLIQNDDTMRTKMFLLQSTPFLEDVVVGLKLDQNAEFYRDFDLSRLSREYTTKPVLEAVTDIAIRARVRSPLPLKNLNTIPPALPENDRNHPLGTNHKIDALIEAVRRHTAVELVPDTRLLKISFVHTDPVMAAYVSNGIAQSFIQRSFETKNVKINQTSDWQQKTTKELKDRAEAAEAAFANYAREHKIFFTPGDKKSLSAEKVARIDAEVTRAETDRTVKESLYAEVKEGRTAQIPQAFTDAKTVELQKKAGELVVKAAELDVSYGPENPQVVEIHQQIAVLNKQIEENRTVIEAKIKADYERAVRDEQSLKIALDQAKVEASEENQDTIHYNILQQQVDSAKSFYQEFLQKTNQSGFELSQQGNNLRVVEPAQVPKSTDGPERFQWILLSMALSLGGGVGIAILLDRFDSAIKNTEDVGRYLHLPVLGIIPAIRASRTLAKRNRHHKLLPEDNPEQRTVGGLIQLKAGRLNEFEDRSPAAEAYRLLRTSVLLSATASSGKTLLFTSSQPREGKTTTCVNTAISLAKLGESVLLIDCDLRGPMVSYTLGMDESAGISTYLTAPVELEKVIQQTRIPNLSILSCGPIPSNPTELISTRKMKEMLETLAGRYDRIIIDSPPLINLADALILSGLSDGVLLVVRGGKTDRNVVRQARLDLSSVGASVLGVVLNNVTSASKADSRYYSYYSRYRQAAAG